MSDQVRPLSVLNCHWTDGDGFPTASEEKDTGADSQIVMDSGCTMIVGGSSIAVVNVQV